MARTRPPVAEIIETRCKPVRVISIGRSFIATQRHVPSMMAVCLSLSPTDDSGGRNGSKKRDWFQFGAVGGRLWWGSTLKPAFFVLRLVLLLLTLRGPSESQLFQPQADGKKPAQGPKKDAQSHTHVHVSAPQHA